MSSDRHRLIILVAVLVLTFGQALGQARTFFGEPLTPAALDHEELAALHEALSDPGLFLLDAAALHAHARQASNAVRLELGDAHAWDLVLEPHDMRAPEYMARVGSGGEVLPRRSPFTYRGHVAGLPGSRARFSLRPDAIVGYVTIGGEEFFIEPLHHFTRTAATGRHVVYTLADVIGVHEAGCGVAHMEELMRGIAPAGEEAGMGGEECRLANIAIAADGSMVNFLGSVPNVEDRVLDILNWVDGKYQEPTIAIAYQVVALFISPNTASDPWTTSQDASTLLNSFRNWGNGGGFGPGISYAVASMWTRRDIQADGSSGVVGLAWVSVVCTSNRYNLNEHYSTGMAGPMVVQAHELGHNWSASHTTAPGQWIMAPTASTSNTNWDAQTINSITNHKSTRTCLGSSCLLLPVAGFSASSTLTCDGTVAFTDLSTFSPSAWLWDFGDGNTSTQQHPVHTYTASGTYDVQLTVTNPTGQGEVIMPGLVTVELLDPPVTSDDLSCGPGTVTLGASGPNTLHWYTTPTGGEPVHTGPIFTTEIAETTTWYVEDSTVEPPLFGGAFSNAIGTGGYFSANANWGLLFNVTGDVTLLSVKVYANNNGTRTIQLLDNGGAVLETRNVFIPSGESRVTLNMDIPPGQQYLLKLSGQTLGLYRNDAGGAYPYAISSSVTITETNAVSSGASNYYYFFYDWEVQEPGCVSARTPVTGVVDPCLGVAAAPATGAIHVFPNPSQGLFTVTWDIAPATAPAYLEVTDALGRRVAEAHVAGTGTWPLQVDGAAGVYHLRAFDAAGAPLPVHRLVVR